MKMYHIILYIAFIAVLVSCKKENGPAVSAVNKTTQQKLQSWFEEQSKFNTGTAQPVLGSNAPNWGKTEYVEGKNLYLTPVVYSKDYKAVKYFAAAANAKDELEKGSYYIVLSESGGSLSKTESLIINAVDNAEKTLSNFSGAVLEYDLNNTLVKTKHYKNGSETSTKDNLVTKGESGTSKTKEIPVNNFQSCAEGEEQVCIDWYWQTFINGVLYSEEYLFSTCSCSVNNGGGGQTNTGGSSGCTMSAAQAQAIVNQVSGMSIPAATSTLTLGAPLGNQPGRIRAPCSGYGGGYKLNIAFGMYIEWSSKYSGWAYKYSSIPNDPWKFESIKYDGFFKMEGSTTMCISTKVATTHSETISTDRKWAYTSGNCYIDVDVSCIGGLIKTSKVGTFGASFDANSMVEQ